MLRFEFLVDARFFEIENLELHLRKRRQLLRGAGKKCGRDIAECVGMQTALEERQNLRSQSTCPCADLQDAQAASFGQSSRCRAHRSGDGREPVAGEKTVAIKLIEQLRADPENKTCTASFSPRKIDPNSAQFPSQRSASGRCPGCFSM